MHLFNWYSGSPFDALNYAIKWPEIKTGRVAVMAGGRSNSEIYYLDLVGDRAPWGMCQCLSPARQVIAGGVSRFLALGRQ